MPTPAQAAFPAHIEKYAESPVFTQDTVPQKLTNVHDTKAGVWGRLCVLEGALDYIVSGTPETVQRVEKNGFAVIEPTVPHHVKIIGPVNFKVEFLK